jgi:hypothetical protein
MTPELYQILLGGGAVAALYVVYLIVRTIFGKKSFSNNGTGKEILGELKKQNENELVHLQAGMEKGFSDLRGCQEIMTNRMCEKMDRMIEALGEIKGILK